MTETEINLLAESALQALGRDDPRKARELLMEAIMAAPSRPDLVHALGVVQLQLGEAHLGLPLIQQAIGMAGELASTGAAGKAKADEMIDGFELSLAAAHEDLDQPIEAEAAYRRALARSPNQPRPQHQYALLLLGWGRLDEGLAELDAYVKADADDPDAVRGLKALAGEIRLWIARKLHPKNLLEAHRESYVEMFDGYLKGPAKGWVAEAAKMRRGPDGRPVVIVPEGARPYAGVRVDLVNPATNQIGQVGDQPMVVQVAEFPALAQAPVQLRWEHEEFDLRVSTQCPWDQLPIHILFTDGPGAEGALEAADELIGEWYSAGFDGAFGTKDGHRLHDISYPQAVRGFLGVTYDVDMGRAELRAIDDLVQRLTHLNARHPIARVLLGRGFLPVPSLATPP
ncbi:MAG: hypothetical protein EXR69_03900 [Myxococcales bacterium]|nr:hypothetical protein [Myxococcales bacterium]